MNIEDLNTLQTEALGKKLIYPDTPRTGEYFFYKFACTTVSGPRNPAKVLELIRFVRTFAWCEEKGPHRALLRLSIKRKQLDHPGVAWTDQQIVNSDQDARLTLEEWLAEQGYPYIAAQAAA